MEPDTRSSRGESYDLLAGVIELACPGLEVSLVIGVKATRTNGGENGGR